MANVIKPKRSYTASNTPSLAAGELAIQCADRKVFMGNSLGTGSVLIASLNLVDMLGNTDNITQGTANKFYTDALARAALSAGTGIGYNTSTGVITNSAPDQTVTLTAGSGISITGTYPSFTVTNTSSSGSSDTIFHPFLLGGM